MFSRVGRWLASLRKARAQSLWPERTVKVVVSDTGLSAVFPTGESQFVSWEDVARVLVATDDSGPWGADVWWVLEGTGVRCKFPQGATGEDAALAEIRRRFPSFEAKGMNSASNATFVCWEKGQAP
jgi:hypothetical protein